MKLKDSKNRIDSNYLLELLKISLVALLVMAAIFVITQVLSVGKTAIFG